MLDKRARFVIMGLLWIFCTPLLIQPTLAAESLLDDLRAMQQANPLDSKSAGDLGRYYHAHEQLDEALLWYAAAIDLKAEDWRWHYLSGLAFTEAARAQEALTALRTAYELAPGSEAVAVQLARISSTLGQFDETVRVLSEALKRNPGSTAVLSELGIASLASGNPSAAVNYLRQALQAEPGANRLYYPLANALRATGNRDAAREAVSQAGSIAPRLADPVADEMRGMSRSYAFYMSQGLLAASSGDLPAARSLLQRAVEQNPADPTVGVNFARVLESLGELALAEAQLERVLGLNPTHGPAWFNLGVLAELAEDDALALKRYETALSMDPDDFRSHLLAASAALRLNQHESAAVHYAQAAQLKPERDELLVRQAVSQWQGDCANAVATALKVVQRRPEDPAALVLYIRLVSTCPAAAAQAINNALNAARNLARLDSSPIMQINLAMAEAASGNYAEAKRVHRLAVSALEHDLSASQREVMGELAQRYQAQQRSNRPFLLNEQVLQPARLTAADRR
ncbi:MAG: tetratricopeptide repeat protein [Lysobacterales bacterium]